MGALAVIAALAGLLWLLGLALVPAVETQSREFAQAFPTLLEEALALANQVQSFFGLGAQIGLNPKPIQSRAKVLTGSTVSTAAGVGLTAATVVSLAAVVFISTIYLVIRPEPWINGFVSLFPAGWRQRTREVLPGTVPNGTAVVPRPARGHDLHRCVLGHIALPDRGALRFAHRYLQRSYLVYPYVGALISIVVRGSGPDLGPLLGRLGDSGLLYHPADRGNLLQPIVMSRAVDLHPAMVVFAILVMGTLFGIVGVFLAVPLVAAVQVLVRELWVKRWTRWEPTPILPPGNPQANYQTR